MKTPATSQKLRGGYYTPPQLARFLVDWAIQSATARVLEPSCGDGVFLSPIVQKLLALKAVPESIANQVTAVEIDKIEVAKAAKSVDGLLRDGKNIRISNSDFFEFCETKLVGQRFDAVVGNPPFIRYQNFPESSREAAFRLMKSSGLHPNRLTNAWVPFVAAATDLLTEHGRLAMVVPAELLQVSYAAELRQFLSDRFEKLTVFTFRHLVFEGIQQEVVLLCGERDGGKPTGIRTIEITDLEELANYEHTPFESRDLKPMDNSREKWTQYFLTKYQIALVRKARNIPGLRKLADFAEVNVGVVTGQNDFFVLKKSDADRIGANGYALPLVSRSGHLRGFNFTKTDLENNVTAQIPTFLLSIPADVPIEKLPASIVSYIREAEAKKLHEGYKCRIRTPWYTVPSIARPDAFMLRQIHERPRIIVNETPATCTDTIHRVRCKAGVDVRRLAACAYNSLTFALAEVMGRSYGGGVLELEPSEAENLLVPYDMAQNIDIRILDELLRNNMADKALDYCDKILLLDGLGLNLKEVTEFRSIWSSLCQRRAARKSKTPKSIKR